AAELDQRARWDEQAGEKETLLASLQERQVLLECLFEIQRAISRREPIQTLLDAVTAGTAKLLGAEVVALRLVDPDAEADAGYLRLVSSVGVDPLLREAISRTPVGEGVGGQAMSEGQPVIADLHGASSPLHPLFQAGLHTAMAVPVHRDGRVVGSLLVASYDDDRSYVPGDQEVLLAFAEHASLALNDASAAEAIRQAYAVALRQATRDPLTDLANRSLVLDRIREAVARGEATGAAPAVLFVDLDGFKKINDSLGHAVGDEVLIRISDRLLGAVRPDDVVARLGGDEFVVLCEGLDERASCEIAESVLRTIAEPLPVYGRSVVLTASIGIARAVGPHQAEDLLRDADVAMYKAKAAGPGRMEVFDQDVRVQMLERLEIEQSLRRALEREELRVHFQPVVEVASGATIGAEALVRWEHPQHGFVMPSSFVHVAEEAGLIVSIGAWVLEEACRERARWEATGLCGPGHRVSVNLSARQFADPGLFAAVEAALRTSGLAGGALCLELTESVLMDDADATLATLGDLRRLGVQLAVDDFGTGYSSLSYLKRFVVDELKIDQGFVRGLGVDRGDEVMVRAIVGLAAALGLEVVAEGVETPEQLAVLRSLGCHRAQGYLFGRPGPGWQAGAHW
ncbi:MAG: EAL domain-containing protein, partial [Acidimicrobiales bacterium]